jgi:hypothetical protein
MDWDWSGGSLAVEILCVLGWVRNGLGFTLSFNNDFLSSSSSSSDVRVFSSDRLLVC